MAGFSQTARAAVAGLSRRGTRRCVAMDGSAIRAFCNLVTGGPASLCIEGSSGDGDMRLQRGLIQIHTFVVAHLRRHAGQHFNQ